jgi:hypothetical protein
MSILKRMRKKYHSINRHEWEQIVENKEREHTSRQLEMLIQYLKQIANDTKRKS